MTETRDTSTDDAGTGDPGDTYRSIWTELRELAFTQGWVEANGVRTRYAEAGPPDAPAVIMLHGTGGHWETFAANLGPFSEHFRCVALDMLGNGFTEKPDYDYEIANYIEHLSAFMDVLGIERASLVGCSLGTWVGARMAIEHPDRVDKMVFGATAGLIATRENMERIIKQRHKAVDDPNWESIKAMFDHLLAEERNRVPDLVALRQAMYRQPSMKEAIDHILALQDWDARQRNLIDEAGWRSIQAPTLLVASGKDQYEDTSRTVLDWIPRAELLEMPHVRHWPHWEDPETFNRAALEFLRR